MDRGAWWAIVHGVAKSWTHTHTHTHMQEDVKVHSMGKVSKRCSGIKCSVLEDVETEGDMNGKLCSGVSVAPLRSYMTFLCSPLALKADV